MPSGLRTRIVLCRSGQGAGAQTMALEFEGQAAYSAYGVNFAGHYFDKSGKRHEVLCRITREAIESICGKTNKASLLSAFREARDRFEALANAQFMAGIDRPHVTSRDISQRPALSIVAA